MKKLNYVLDKNNVITSYFFIPFNENSPYIEVEDNQIIHVGFDKVIDNKLVTNDAAYTAALQKSKEKQAKENELLLLKNWLDHSDIYLFQHIEGYISDEDYKPIKEQRQEYREKIRKLQDELGIS